MRIHVLSALLLALIAAAPGVRAQALSEEDANRPIARVGDELITIGEFTRQMQIRIQEVQAATGKPVNPDVRFRRALMNELVQGHVLSVAARNAGVEITDEELAAEFEERKAALGDEGAYQEYLNRMNLTEEALKENMRSRMRVTRFVDQNAGEISASDEEITETYEALKKQGVMTRTEKTRDIAAILLRPDGESDEAWRAAEERANAVHGRLAAGEDFQELARELSDEPNTASRGGLIREMKHGSFYPELEEAMDALEPGAFSKPVRSAMGWYLVTVVQENEPGTIPLEGVREGVEMEVIEGKRRAAIAEIVADAQKLMRIEMLGVPEEAGAGSPGGGAPDAPADGGVIAPAEP